MNIYGLNEVLTFDVEDFKRFSGITALHPKNVLPSAGQ